MNTLAHRLAELVGRTIPLPGAGDTLTRWRALAEVAAEDVCLVKLYEGHTDALAILAELAGPPAEPGAVWATWAAEPPTARLALTRRAGGVVLDGRKAWCSGADVADHAVITAWDPDGRQCLVAVNLGHEGVHLTTEGWHAVGMARARSGDVLFDAVPAIELGKPGDYTSRPGFWQGGAGIAACWYGGVLPLATALGSRVGPTSDPHAAAHLGAIDLALTSARSLLDGAASWIDAHPRDDAQLIAMRARGAVEEAVQLVIEHAGRALGAGPLCRDADLAQRYADLPIFLRQSHAERDRADLGRLVSGESWAL